MHILITDDDGAELYSYDTAKDAKCVFPGAEERPAVIEALQEALRLLRSPGEDD